MNVSEELAGVFRNSGYEDVSDSLAGYTPQECTVFQSRILLVALVSAVSAEVVSHRWIDDQLTMARLRHEQKVDDVTDLYLVYLVPSIVPQDMQFLHEPLCDTRIARKLCLSVGGRSMADVFAGTPLLPIPRESSSVDDSKVDGQFPGGSLPRQLLDDLAKQSAGTILSQLLAGSYRHTQDKSHNAD